MKLFRKHRRRLMELQNIHRLKVKPEITFDDFEKVQFRVAKVLTCEAVKKTKLLKFELQIGDEKRTIVSGIQKYYKPEELIGKKLVVCTNLKPRKDLWY